MSSSPPREEKPSSAPRELEGEEPEVKEKPVSVEELDIQIREERSESKAKAEKILLPLEGHSGVETESGKCVHPDTKEEASSAGDGGSAPSAVKSKTESELSSSGDSFRSASSAIIKKGFESSSSGDSFNLEKRTPSASSIVKSKPEVPSENAPLVSSIMKSKKENEDSSEELCRVVRMADSVTSRKIAGVQAQSSGKESLASRGTPDFQESSTRESLCLQDMYVRTFHPKFPELVIILSEKCLAGDAKYRVAEALGMCVQSVCIFGLFEHKMGKAIMVVSDEVPMKYCKNVCFQRFSFDDQLELDIIRNDQRCMEMIYYECMFMLDHDMFFPSIKDPRSPCREKASTNSMLVSLQRLRQKKLSYWTFYYRVDNCTLCSPNLISDPSICQRDVLLVAFDLNYLIFYNGVSDTVSFFRWDQVHSVQMCPLKNNIIRYSVEDKSKKGTIVLFSDLHHDYIFAVSIYLIKLHESMTNRRSLFRSGPDFIGHYLIFFNDGFKGSQKELLSAPTRLQHHARVMAFEKYFRDEELHQVEVEYYTEQSEEQSVCPQEPAAPGDSAIPTPCTEDPETDSMPLAGLL